mmetsp:Transcript_50424/g.119904  ORF Transcript_50424/g.119904 Transcript_50424/m.119904 type:complete len:203 (+) Transcript_50424:203-811(+)
MQLHQCSLQIGRQVTGSHHSQLLHVLELHPGAVEKYPLADCAVFFIQTWVVFAVGNKRMSCEGHMDTDLMCSACQDSKMYQGKPSTFSPKCQTPVGRHIPLPQGPILCTSLHPVLSTNDAAELSASWVLPLHQWQVYKPHGSSALIGDTSHHQSKVLLLDLMCLVGPLEVLKSINRLCKYLHPTGILVESVANAALPYALPF